MNGWDLTDLNNGLLQNHFCSSDIEFVLKKTTKVKVHCNSLVYEKCTFVARIFVRTESFRLKATEHVDGI